jgi:hypothetical protein
MMCLLFVAVLQVGTERSESPRQGGHLKQVVTYVNGETAQLYCSVYADLKDRTVSGGPAMTAHGSLDP